VVEGEEVGKKGKGKKKLEILQEKKVGSVGGESTMWQKE
jgi:hypothetical protein